MNVSSTVKYGFQFMLQLCDAEKNNYIQVKDVAKKEGISEKYLEHVVSLLKAARLIEVKRGAKGGYRLQKKPGEITLLEIFNALEKIELTTGDINKSGIPDTTNKEVIFDFLSEFEILITSYLKKKSLKDLHATKSKFFENINFQI